MILFDTDILTLFVAGDHRIHQRAVQEIDHVEITVISRIEVLQGRFDYVLKAATGRQLQLAQGYLMKSDRDLATLKIIPIDASAADIFDQLRENKKLKKIGRADLLIASIALAHRATLITRNLKHFQLVPGLAVENWAD
jgi:tRNA(fMet)-specific endonuclease VapC